MRRNVILIAVVALLVAGAAYTPQRLPVIALAANPAQADAQTDEKNGDKLRVAHQYQAAIDAYQKALAANPKLASAYIGMGIAYLKMHYYDDAEAALKKGLAIAPDNVTGLRYLAETYEATNRDAEASDVAKRGLVLAPERYD